MHIITQIMSEIKRVLNIIPIDTHSILVPFYQIKDNVNLFIGVNICNLIFARTFMAGTIPADRRWKWRMFYAFAVRRRKVSNNYGKTVLRNKTR